MSFPHYILAAGHGRRAGGPKAWRAHEGRTLLSRHIEAALRRVEPGDIAVSIQADWVPRCQALHTDVRWVPTDPDASPLASLQHLVRALPLRTWGFVYHVDMPLWSDGPFEALQQAARTSTAQALVPTWDDRGGHPVMLAATLAPALLQLDATTDRLDHWLRAQERQRVPVDDASILANWNQIEDADSDAPPDDRSV